MNMNILQQAITSWHRAKWPSATFEKIALKFAEEAGEVAGAVNKHNDANLKVEIGDALMVLSSLAGRKDWYLLDLLAEAFERNRDREFPYDPDEVL